MEQRTEVPAVWDSIERLIAFVDRIEASMGLTDEQGYLMRLVIEEVATNIIKYSYSDGETGIIQLACRCSNGVLHVAIRDHGQPFDPNDCPEPDLHDDVATRTVGGLGLFLVREFSDHISYHHDAQSGWNELLVVKGQG